jgi:hypothetical protein
MSEVKKNELQVILDEQNVPAENAKALLEAFGAPFTEAGEILAVYQDIKVTDESQTEDMAKAKEMRLSLKRVRTGVENTRKDLKDGYLKAGRAIDSVAKFVKETIQPAEEYLELQEKFLENKLAKEAAQLKADRIEKLSKYTDDLSIYNFDTMREDAFDKLLSDLKQAHEDKLKAEKEEADRIETERKAEEQRQKDIEEENERLKADAEAKEKADAIIRDRINRTTALGLTWNDEKQAYISGEFVITAQEIKELNDTQFDNLISNTRKKVTELQETQRKADEAKRAEDDAKLEEERKKAESDRIEREKLEKAEQDRKAREEADQKAKEDAERAALLSPDKDKINSFSNALGIIRNEKLPAVKTKQAQDIVNFIDTELADLQAKIADKVKSL